ncbi:MAG: glycosyltransferase family 4 protein [Gammaproteobacteria bacterium]
MQDSPSEKILREQPAAAKPLYVIALGLRGFPDIQGGIETHAENLYPLLVKLGCKVEVIARAAYLPRAQRAWRGVEFRRLWSPRRKSLETIIHTLLGVLYAGVKRPDILHIHAIGPALLVPLARLLRLNVVVTHHGADYERQKWGGFSRGVLRAGERFGMRHAQQRIVISDVIGNLVRTRHARDSVLIHNGVVLPQLPTTTAALQAFDLTPGRYVLLVSRLVPEKRHLDLIEAFACAQMQGWKLVLVGVSEYPDDYTRAVLSRAAATPDVVCTGFQSGLALQELYAHAGIFVLPSSHEGLPIALLEALSFGLPVIASAIPANLEIGLDQDRYFPLGDTHALAKLLRNAADQAFTDAQRHSQRAWVQQRYNWETIAQKTYDTYLLACARAGKSPVFKPAPAETSNDR